MNHSNTPREISEGTGILKIRIKKCHPQLILISFAYFLFLFCMSSLVLANSYNIKLDYNKVLSDTFVYESLATDNFGTETSLFVNNASSFVRYGLIKYDTSQFSSSTIIQNAELNYYIESLDGGSNTLFFYQLFNNYSWHETTVTWNTRPTTTQYNLTSTNSSFIPTISAFYKSNITNILKNCTSSSNVNCSILLLTNGSNAVELRTKEAVSNRHYINITYFIDDKPYIYNFNQVSGTNKTLTNVSYNFTLIDDLNISSWLYSNNMSGVWVNSSRTYITGTNITNTFTFNLSNVTVNKNVCFQLFFNDSINNKNNSDISCLNVVNTEPIISQSIINSNDFSKNSYYNGNCTFNDADNNTISRVYFQWFRNNQLNLSGYLDGTFQLSTSYIINYTNTFSEGDRINFSCLAFDGQSNSSWLNSSTIKINSTPTIITATITPDPAIDSDDLVCNPIGVNDVDGDTILYTYQWYKNSVNQNINAQILNNANTSTSDDWYCKVKVGDLYYNSSFVQSQTVTIGSTFSAPVITYVNATSGDTGRNSTITDPTFNNTYITLQANISDVNTNEKHTIFFCKSNQFNSFVCDDGEWNRTLINLTGTLLSSTISITGLSGTYDYYAFAVDNASYISYAKKGNFSVDTPPTIPSTNVSATYYLNKNVSILFTSTDLESDSINYSVWNSTDAINFFSLGITTGISNFIMPEGGPYYYYAFAIDQHNYNSSNMTTQSFYIDLTKPNMTLQEPSGSKTSRSITALWSANDTFLNECNYNVTLLNTNILYYGNSVTSCSLGGVSLDLAIDGAFTFNLCALDLAGNSNCSSKNFTISTSNPGGGGGPPTSIINQTTVNQTIYTNVGVTCNFNDVCDFGETVLGCRDCYQTKSAQFVLLFIVILVVTLIIYNQNKEKIDRYIKMPRFYSTRRR